MPSPIRPPAGEMDTLVSIMQDVESADSHGYGQVVATPQIVAKVWAKVEPQTGREFFRASQVYATMTDLLTIDFMENLSVKMKVMIGKRNLNIVGIIDVQSRHIVQQVACVEVVT